VIVGLPCEVFAEIGLELKRRSPLRLTFTIDLANGYLPSSEQHALGGYETWRATSSYLEVQASRKMTEALLETLNEVGGQDSLVPAQRVRLRSRAGTRYGAR
jgi:neutral ceramidase